MTENRKRAIELVEKLPKEKLNEAVNFLEFLCLKANQVAQPRTSNSEEITLLQIIQRRLLPEEQKRLDYLRQNNEMGTLNEAEHDELLAYVERVEREDAERAEALIQLARIRQVDLATLLSEFTKTGLTQNGYM